MAVDLSGGSFNLRMKRILKVSRHSFILNSGSIPTLYREVFEMFNQHGLNKLTFTIFVPLFESNTLTKTILNQASLIRNYIKNH